MMSWLLFCVMAHGGSAMALNDPNRPYVVELDAELGFLAPLSHTIQFGSEGDVLDYVEEGGQDNLFPFARPTAAIEWRRQRFTFLWQPLTLNSTVSLDRKLRVDDLVFAAGKPIDLTYGFSFWRASWAHDVLRRDRASLRLGLGLQIRNATIGFTATDGSQSETNRDIGPVPLLELEWRAAYEDGVHLEAEVDGFYAPIKYLNGRGVDVIGVSRSPERFRRRSGHLGPVRFPQGVQPAYFPPECLNFFGWGSLAERGGAKHSSQCSSGTSKKRTLGPLPERCVEKEREPRSVPQPAGARGIPAHPQGSH